MANVVLKSVPVVPAKPNYLRLSDGSHLVRTQAGYHDLIKRRCGEELEELYYPTNYPKSYPAVVRLYNRYQWAQGLCCEWQTVDDYKDKLLAQLKEVSGE